MCWIGSDEIEVLRSLNACTFSLQNKLSRCCFCNQKIKDRVRHAGGPCDLILFVRGGQFMLYVICHTCATSSLRVAHCECLIRVACRRGKWQDYTLPLGND